MDLAAQFNTAVAAQEAGRLAEAEQGFTAILAVADHLPTLHNLGVICDATERIDEAARPARLSLRGRVGSTAARLSSRQPRPGGSSRSPSTCA